MLTPKQNAFVAAFLDGPLRQGKHRVRFSATGAARHAGYSAKSARVLGQRLTRHPEVARRIEEGLRRREEEYDRSWQASERDRLQAITAGSRRRRRF